MIRTLCLLAALLVAVPVAALDLPVTETLPVQHDGRVKPLDTYARVHLLAFHGKRSMKELGPTEWVLESAVMPDRAHGRDLFLVRNPEVAQALGLPSEGRKRFTFSEMVSAVQTHADYLRTLHRKEYEERALVERQLVDLYVNTLRYADIRRALGGLAPRFHIHDAGVAGLLGLEPHASASYLDVVRNLDAFRARLGAVNAKPAEERTEADREVVSLAEQFRAAGSDAQSVPLRIIPPLPSESKEDWYAPWELLQAGGLDPAHGDLLVHWSGLLRAYGEGDAARVEQLASEIALANDRLTTEAPGRRLSIEAWYNGADLFYKSVAFYILSFLLLITSWMLRPRLLRRLALYALLAGVALHLGGMVLRMVIMGRPPVSTLYESIVFVGMIGAMTGAWVEWARRDGLGIFLGATAGAVLHFLGFSYAADGDTLGMLVAVLNSNFWLATHVVTITIGYGGSLVAGLAGHVYLARAAFRPHPVATLEDVARNMRGLTLVAVFFTLFGTILGGIWADQSWGRFWGWDPKENGALLIVIWQLLLLHGLVTGILRAPAFAVGLVLNNIVVALAWFGVNLLNVGLHTYGFTDQILTNLAAFCAVEVAFVAITYPLARRRAGAAPLAARAKGSAPRR